MRCAVCDMELTKDRPFVEIPQGMLHEECFSAVWDQVWFHADRTKTVAEIKAEVKKVMRYLHGGEATDGRGD